MESTQLSHIGSLSEMSRMEMPSLCLDLVRVGPSMLYRGVMPEACYTLAFVLKCPGEARSFNFGKNHGEGYMGFFPPGGDLDARNPAGCADAILSVPVAVFEAAVARYFPSLPSRMMATGAGVRVGVAEQLRLRSLIERMERMIAEGIREIQDSSWLAAFEESLLSSFLDALRSGLSSELSRPGLRTGRRLERLGQAREFIAENFNGPIFLEDLCATMGLSMRGVENTFQDYLGMGPIDFVRQHRLHVAHRALQDSDPKNSSVKRAALECGFRHLGRFSKDYRNVFGLYPYETLKRG